MLEPGRFGSLALLLIAFVVTACGEDDTSHLDGSSHDAMVCSAGESYTACGCGCCSGVPVTTRCVDVEHGETLESIAHADQVAAASPGCAMAGCSAPIEHVCCP